MMWAMCEPVQRAEEDGQTMGEPLGSLFGRPRAEVEAAFPDRESVVCPICQVEPRRFAVDFQGLSLARCPTCRLELHSPRPTLEQMARAVYGEHYHRADEAPADARHRRQYGRQVDRLEQLQPAGRRLLDVGCGAGAFLRFGRERGWDVEGTDYVLTPWARESGARVWEGELPLVEFGGARFDVVRFNHVLEHTRDPLSELRAARSVLSPGGVLLIGVPNLAGASLRVKSWQSRLGLKGKRWRHYAALHHLWFFTPATLSRLVETAGFEVAHWETPVLALSRGPRLAYDRLVERLRTGGILDLYARAV